MKCRVKTAGNEFDELQNITTPIGFLGIGAGLVVSALHLADSCQSRNIYVKLKPVVFHID